MAKDTQLLFTRYFDEGIPDAGPSAVLGGGALHLIGGGRRSEHEILWKAASAQPSHVEIDGGFRRDIVLVVSGKAIL